MTKFKVGDWVNVKGSKEVKFHIVEVLEQTCYAGTQIHYTGRVFIKEMIYSRNGNEWHPAKDTQKFLEIELEERKVIVPSSELQDKVKKYREVKERKVALCKLQDFEEAANVRDEEVRLKNVLELGCIKENIDIDELLLE